MLIKFKRIIAVMLFTALLLAFSACSLGSNSQISSSGEASLTFEPANKTIKTSWFVPWWEKADKYQYIFDEFARMYPDYKIEDEFIGELSILAAAIQAGTQPDMWMGGDPNYSNFTMGIYQNLFAPIDKYLQNDPDYNFNNLDVQQLEPLKFHGSYYALPYLTASGCMVYNKTLFAQAGLDPEKPPETFTEFYEYTKKLTKFDSNGVVTQLGLSEGPWSWSIDYLKKGGAIADNKFDSTYNSDWMLYVFEYCNKFTTIIGSNNSLPKDVTFAFENGNVAMAGATLGNLNDIAQSGVDFGFAKSPRPDDYPEQIVGARVWYYLTIPKEAKNPDGGWLFMKYIMTDGQYQTVVQNYQKNPASLFPTYIIHKPTREKVYNDFGESIKPEIKALIEKRDAMINDNTYTIKHSPIHLTLKDIEDKWWRKYSKGEVGLRECLMGIHTEYQSNIEIWKNDLSQKGWTFPEGGEAIPPADYNK